MRMLLRRKSGPSAVIVLSEILLAMTHLHIEGQRGEHVQRQRATMWTTGLILALLGAATQTVQSETVQNKSLELHLLGLFPFTRGSWLGGRAALLAVNMALEHINNRTDILPDHTLKLHYKDSQCLGGPGTNALFQQLYTPPVKHIVLGGACSVVCQPTAEASHSWNISQLAYGCGSPSLSDKSKYPRFFRTGVSDAIMIPPRFEMMRLFNWKKIATIHQSYDLFSFVTDSMLKQLGENTFLNASVLTSEVFLTDPSQQVENLQNNDARIIFAGCYEDAALKVFCEAYKRGMYGPKYAWMTVSWYHNHDWWRLAEEKTDCTNEQVRKAIDGLFYIGQTHINPIDERGLAGITYSELVELFKQESGGEKLVGGSYVATFYDGMWTVAAALNQTVNILKEIGHPKDLADFAYSDGDIGDIVTETLFDIDFAGVLGPVKFDENGDPYRTVAIDQQQGEKRVTVAYFRPSPSGEGGLITWANGGIKWKGGRPPRDSTTHLTQHVYVSDGIYGVMCTFSTLGMILSVCFLVFNIVHRHRRLIKMSSPNINNVTLVGCLLCYCTTFLQERPSHSLEEETLCVMRMVFFLAGFSMALGALFSKTWRIHRIVTMSTKTLQKVVIRDSRLFVIVLALVLVNMTILVIWGAVDPQTLSIENMETKVSASDPDVEITPQQHKCTCDYNLYFSGCLYLVQGLLLAFGAFLAWETRKVTVEAINDSKLIGVCIYNVLALSIMGTAASQLVSDNMDVSYGFISGCVIFGTTLVQCIIFCPKVLGIMRGGGNAVVNTTDGVASNAHAPSGAGFLFKPAQASQNQSSSTGRY